MNALVLMVLALAALAAGYRFYSRKVAGWIGLDESITPPAVELEDGIDYVPAKHWTMLFGHHFASIAGAAPIIGPVIACLFWGWLPAVIWIVVGGIFFGAVHDYFSLASSVENKGRSVGDLSETVLGRSAKIVFSVFVFLALILVVAVFAAVAGKTLATTPEVVLPTFGLILVAMGVGLLVYRTNIPLIGDTLFGLALLTGLIVLGHKYPISLPDSIGSPAKWWTIILLVYGLVASVLPVSLLLQPRDHLASGVLFFGMLFGFGGVLISRPAIHAPAVIAFSGDKGWLWPMLFVTVACGAISGFHSLVSSGTTSKQLARIRDARPVGFGGMILESALALLAVIAVTAGLYWTKEQIPAGVDGYVYKEVFKGGNWIKAFGVGYGQITKGLLGSFGTLVGITMLKTFVMTTLDSATRITRYLCNELLGDTFGLKPFRNRYVATLLVGVCSGWLALGNWKAIWPIFGSANQLIAAMVLIVATAYLATRGRACLFTAIPAALVLPTTIGALVYQLVGFVRAEEPDYPLAALAVVLILLALFVSYKGIEAIRSGRAGARTGCEPSSGEAEAVG